MFGRCCVPAFHSVCLSLISGRINSRFQVFPQCSFIWKDVKRWAGHVARMEKGKSVFKIFTGKPTGKRPFGRLRCRWENNIRMYLKEIAIHTINCVDSAQDRDYWGALVNAALNLRVS